MNREVFETEAISLGVQAGKQLTALIFDGRFDGMNGAEVSAAIAIAWQAFGSVMRDNITDGAL